MHGFKYIIILNRNRHDEYTIDKEAFFWGGGGVFAPQCINIRPCICISLLQLYPFFIVKLCQRESKKRMLPITSEVCP